ncbi:MAG TPA: XRE family transcriptional regulator [Candidatus Dormibacteraeota bacterium]|nr:XRE family transcriptional regulator [Candidatus Dormibacteraeota bacterium]
MPKNFRDRHSKLTPEARQRVEERVQREVASMRLGELRRALALSQQTVADILGMDQPSISRLEHQTDALISTLGRYVEAMGGQLEILVRFPDREEPVEITQFFEPEAKSAELRKAHAATARL